MLASLLCKMVILLFGAELFRLLQVYAAQLKMHFRLLAS